MLPDISIITVTYNAEKTLIKCIESVACQDVEVEHILIDGNSTDGTTRILDKYRDQLSRVVIEPDQGIYDAMNKGIKLATSDILGIMNADDYYPSYDILAKVCSLFEDTTVDACYGNLKYVDAADINKVIRYWKAGDYNISKFYWGWMPPHPTFFVRKAVYERYGLFNLELGTSADYEIMLRFLLKYKINAAYIPETLVHMRTGGVSNVSIKNRLKANAMDRKAWDVNNLKPYPWTLYLKPLRKVLQWVRK